MRIGELAKRTGVSVATIRFYEREGWLPRAQRRANGYRDFSNSVADQLQLLVACRRLGIPLARLHVVVRSASSKHGSCSAVSRLIDEEIGQLRSRIRDLHGVMSELQRLAKTCGPGRTMRQCGILGELKKRRRQPGYD